MSFVASLHFFQSDHDRGYGVFHGMANCNTIKFLSLSSFVIILIHIHHEKYKGNFHLPCEAQECHKHYPDSTWLLPLQAHSTGHQSLGQLARKQSGCEPGPGASGTKENEREARWRKAGCTRGGVEQGEAQDTRGKLEPLGTSCETG